MIHFDFLENSFNEYECDMCGDDFKDEESLKKHEENDHTPIEYHTCDVCGYILIGEEKMKKHKRKEHGSKYGCQPCEETFLDESSLYSHMETHQETNVFETTFFSPSKDPREGEVVEA